MSDIIDVWEESDNAGVQELNDDFVRHCYVSSLKP